MTITQSALTIHLGADPQSSENCDIYASTLKEAAIDADQLGLLREGILTRIEIVVPASRLAVAWSPMDLSAFSSALHPDAEVLVRVSGNELNDFTNTSDLFKSIHTAFLLTGLVGTGEKRDPDGSRVIMAMRKATQGPASKAMPLKKLMDEELIDEDSLLADSSNLLLAPPTMNTGVVSSKSDCGGRQACDNCTCGRADGTTKNANVQATGQKSSCGKCSLGDAFRCASCPYLGKPAFKPGEEHLVLDLQDDL